MYIYRERDREKGRYLHITFALSRPTVDPGRAQAPAKRVLAQRPAGGGYLSNMERCCIACFIWTVLDMKYHMNGKWIVHCNYSNLLSQKGSNEHKRSLWVASDTARTKIPRISTAICVGLSRVISWRPAILTLS